MRRPALLAATLLALGAAAHAAPALTGIAPLRRAALPGLAGRGSPTSVALTFDDGPDPASTPAFLDALDALDVRATFFVLGEMLERAPDLGRRIVDEGHEIAVHGWTHRNHLRLGWWQIDDEVARTIELVEATTGERPVHYRPPYGVIAAGDLLAARKHGVRTVLWTAWGRDWEATATPGSVVERLERGGIEPAATLLLHDSDCTSAPGAWRSALGALPDVVARSRARGLTVVPLRDHLR